MKITAETLVETNQMITVPTRSWGHLETKLRELKLAFAELEIRKAGLFLPRVLFRGHADASWYLDTTLERYPVEIPTLTEYYEAAYLASHEIESTSEHAWSLPPPHEFAEVVSRTGDLGLVNLPGYEYLVYLRHHGFPSPLLDWTRSPYVAAFFAFSSAQPQSKRVAIFAYLGSTGVRVGSVGSAAVHPQGPYVRTHRRHYLQQAEYTICASLSNSQWRFHRHETAMGGIEGQDVIVKFTVPTSERIEVLKRLDEANLNAFSLFGSQDALMSTMALRQFEFSDRLRQRRLSRSKKP